MVAVPGFAHFGGRHGELAALKNLLAHAGVVNPCTGRPCTEALCFGIAGGIGAGYSFCPSVVRYGNGSGISIVGRHKDYATGPTWYADFFDRIGAATRITEATGPGKAAANLRAELAAGRPAVVWCGRPKLPFLGNPTDHVGLWMHTFIVYALGDDGTVYGSDRAPTPVTLTADELVAARAAVCSHKNRTLTFDPPAALTGDAVRAAVRAGIAACATELRNGRMKTFSLPGLESWAKLLVSTTNKDGWGKVFADGLLYNALRDTFNSVETCGTGGGLFRRLYADFLDEAAAVLGSPTCAALAHDYRGLAAKWTDLAEAALPSKVKPFKLTKDLLRKQCAAFEEKGDKGTKQFADARGKLAGLETAVRADFPLSPTERTTLLADLRDRVVELHRLETAAADRLATLAG